MAAALEADSLCRPVSVHDWSFENLLSDSALEPVGLLSPVGEPELCDSLLGAPFTPKETSVKGLKTLHGSHSSSLSEADFNLGGFASVQGAFLLMLGGC